MPRGKTTGFDEKTQRRYDAGAERIPRREKIRLGEGGRFVIPAAMREEMGVKPGDQMIMHVVDGELRVRNWRDALRRVQEEASKLKAPGESVVDDFLKERREEAIRSSERLDRLHEEGMALKKDGG